MIAALQRATPVALATLALVAGVPAVSDGSRALAQPGVGPDAAAGSVAVLSFINISGDSADDWIGTGIAESLASELNRAGIAAVRAETASLPRATEVGLGAVDAIIETGRALRAAWIVTGAYQRVADRLRITARVFDAGTGTAVDAATVDGPFDDLFDVQDQVAARLRDAFGPNARRAAARVSTPDPPPATEAGDRFARPPPDDFAGGRRDPGTGERVGPGPGGPMTGRPGGRPGGPMTGRPGGRPGGPMTGRPGGPVPEPAGRPASEPQAQPAGFGSISGVIIDGPPPPAAPEIVNRDAQGRATVRAVRLRNALRVDGVLDDGVYETVPSIEGFVQQLPIEGAPTTERTEAWVFFDDENVYVAAKLWSSVPESQWIANEMQRDSFQIINNDYFSVGLDTFYDRRNGFAFMITPIGGFFDYEITDEGNPNNDWNPIWDSSTGRFDGGWTVEMAIPFKSLRFRPGVGQVWGLQLGRRIRYKNETTYLTTVPISAGPGMFRLSAAGTVTGLEVPSGNRRFEVKPYAIGSANTNLTSSPQVLNETAYDGGLDVKYGLTQNLTADFTYNTDFAQVEADEAQLNLSRFNLFFPEKREFFLEGRGIFDFGRAAGNAGGQFRASRLGGSGFFGGGDVPTVFYSRRIGLTGGETVPILGGARLTGKAGRYSIGALNIQTDGTSGGTLGTNFTALRVKRDILRRSRIGGIFTGRSVSVNGNDTNEAFGLDAAFSFYDNVNFYGYYARTRTRGLELESDAVGNEQSYQAAFNYTGDLYGLQAEHLVVGDAFNPEVGFVRRDDFLRNYVLARYSPRPSMDTVRQFTWEGSYDYFENGLGVPETRIAQGIFGIEFENSDRVSANFEERYDLVPREFNAAGVVPIPVGQYDYRSIFLSYAMGQQRRVSGTLSLWQGGYYHGDITAVGYQRGRVEITPQFSLEPGLSINHMTLPADGTYTVPLITSRVTYTFTPRMFFGGLIQYSPISDTISANLRLRWEYQPGSELFVVYNDQRDVADFSFGARRWPELQNRAFVIKFNRLFRF
jgi:TolB-like protein